MGDFSKAEEKRYEELQRMALNFARYGQSSELEKMILHGLSVNLQDEKGNTLLMLAAYNGQEKVVQMLLKHGADVDLKNDRGQTPLAGVCFKGYFNITKVLVENGANIRENNGLGATPLTFAALFGHKDIVEYLNAFNKSKLSIIKYKLISKFIGLFKKETKLSQI